MSRREVIVLAPPAPLPPRIPAGVLALRTGPAFRDRGPALVDIDGDGAKDLVALAWRHGQDALPLHVVAFDRKTFAVRWRAGPYPSAWRSSLVRLDITAPSVQVRDGRGTVHVLDLKTGRELSARADEPGGVRETNANEDGCRADGTGVCTTEADPALLPKAAGAFRTPHVYLRDYTTDGDRFTHVSVSGPRGGFIEHAVLWDVGARKPRWNVPLVPAPQVEKRVNVSPNAWTALAHGRVLHLYQPTGGLFRIAGRDVKTGALIFDSPVPGLVDGSLIGAFTAEAEDAFIVANESLVVIDGRTGQVVQRLSRF